MDRRVATRIEHATDYLARLHTREDGVRPASADTLAPGFPDLPESTCEADCALGVGTSDFQPSLREGCYHLAFTPTGQDSFTWPATLGTLRLEQPSGGALLLSADVYRSSTVPLDFLVARQEGQARETGPRSIPAFPRADYYGYLRSGALPPLRGTVAASRAGPTARLKLHLHRIQSVAFNTWYPSETLFLDWGSDSPGHGSGQGQGPIVEASFDVFSAAGGVLGRLRIAWISPYFREALIEIDTERGLSAPLDNGSGETWESTFGRVGWLVRTETGTLETPTPPSGAWTYSEIHDAMLRSRSAPDLDSEWRYHVSVVRAFAGDDAPLGIAYDHEVVDSNDVPREGVAIHAEARMPDFPIFGRFAGRLLRECPDLEFQICVHEIGHAMGLYHNEVGFGVMERVGGLARRSRAGFLTPESLLPEFAPDDILRLRHLPDIYVRPGGTTWETQGLVETRDDAHARVAGLHLPRIRTEATLDSRSSLAIAPVARRLPLGAPARIDFEWTNLGAGIQFVPERLSLATPFVRGWVIGPDGDENEFRSLFKAVSRHGLKALGPGALLQGSLTILRGHRGALFRRPGTHTIWLEVGWTYQGRSVHFRKPVRLETTAPESSAHRRAARLLDQTPEALGYLVMGRSDAFHPGERAIDEAMETEALRSHFAYIKAKALATAHFRRRQEWGTVADLLADESHVAHLNRWERANALRFQERASRQGQEGTESRGSA